MPGPLRIIRQEYWQRLGHRFQGAGAGPGVAIRADAGGGRGRAWAGLGLGSEPGIDRWLRLDERGEPRPGSLPVPIGLVLPGLVLPGKGRSGHTRGR